jgi:hypothetical protein
VRVFGGWDFTADEVGNPEWVWVEQGYKRGVRMGGDLPNRPEGKAPTFMVKAGYDPEGPISIAFRSSKAGSTRTGRPTRRSSTSPGRAIASSI